MSISKVWNIHSKSLTRWTGNRTFSVNPVWLWTSSCDWICFHFIDYFLLKLKYRFYGLKVCVSSHLTWRIHQWRLPVTLTTGWSGLGIYRDVALKRFDSECTFQACLDRPAKCHNWARSKDLQTGRCIWPTSFHCQGTSSVPAKSGASN